MENSAIIQSTNRGIAQASSDDARADALEKELGLTDEHGNDQTQSGLDSAAKIKEARTQKIQGYIDKKNEPPPKPKEGEGAKPDFLQEAIDRGTGKVFAAAAADAVQGMVNGGIAMINWMNKSNITGQNWFGEIEQTDFADKLFPKANLSTSQRMIRGAAQFAIPFTGLQKGFTAAGMTSQALSGGIAGAATDFFALEGTQENLSNLIQDVPWLQNPVANFLAHKKDDTELQGRMKNMLEGAGIGILAEGVTAGVSFIKRLRGAKKSVAIADHIEATKGPDGKIDPNIEQQIKEGKQINPPGEAVTVDEAMTPREAEAERGRGQINSNRHEGDQQLKDIIQTMGEKNRTKLEAKIPTIAHEDIRKAPLVPLEKIMKMKPEKFMEDDVARHSLRVYFNSAVGHMKNLAKIAVESPTPANYAKYLEAENMARQLHFWDSVQGTRGGQILNQRNMLIEGSELMGEANLELIRLNGGMGDVADRVKMFAELPSVDQDAVMRKSLLKRWGSALMEMRYANLLRRPTTWIKNEMGNMGAMAFYDMARGIAPAVDKVFGLVGRSAEKQTFKSKTLKDIFARNKALKAIPAEDLAKLTPEERLAHMEDLDITDKQIKQAYNSKVTGGEFKSELYSHLESIGDDVRSYWNAMLDTFSITKNAATKEGKTVTDLAEQYAKDPFTKIEYKPAITSENLGGGKIVDAIGEMQRIPMNVLQARDNFWKIVNHRAEINSAAERLATLQELAGPERKAFIEEFTQNPPDWLTNFDDGIATRRARRNTFTEALDDKMSQAIDKVINSDQLFGIELPIQPIKFWIPFSKTKLNLTKFALDFSPLAPLTNRYQNAIKAGGAEAQMARAQMVTGYAVLGATTTLALSGRITGAGPKDPRMNKIWRDQGNQPFAIKIGDRQIPLKDIEPIGSVVALASGLAEISQHIGSDISVEEAQSLGGLVSWTVINSFSPEFLIDGMADLTEAMKTGDFTKVLSEVATSSTTPLPLSYTSDVVNRTKRDASVDPNQKEHFALVQQIINSYKEKIPGLSSTLPARKNIWGEDVTYPAGVAEELASPLIGTKADNNDPLVNEFVRLGDTGVIKHTLPPGEKHLTITMPHKYLQENRGVVKFSPEEYAKFVELAAGKGLKGAPPLREKLTEMVKSDYYKRLPDQAKRRMLKKEIETYRQRAKGQMIMENKSIRERLMESQKQAMEAELGEQ